MLCARRQELNFDHFDAQDSAFYDLPSEQECQPGTALPELRQLPQYATARDAMATAATDFEARYYGTARPRPAGAAGAAGPARGAGEAGQDHLLASCGGVSGEPRWAAREVNGFAASASSKRQGAGHDWHHHIHASMSGVYYIKTPPGSSGISFDDGAESVTFQPEPGDIVVFPSWLAHSVANMNFEHEAQAVRSQHLANAGRESRVSISFDIKGVWRLGGDGADASS